MLNLVVTYLLGIAARWLGLKAYGVLDLINFRHDAYLFADSSLASLFADTVFVIGPVEELVRFLPVLARGHPLPRLRRTARRHNLRVFRGPRLWTVREFSLRRVCSGCGGFCARSGNAPRADNVCIDLGYRCTEARIQRDGVARAALTALALAAFLHRLYDFVMIGLPPWYRPLSAYLIPAIWVWRMRLIRRLTDRSSVRTRTARTLARDVAGEHARTPCEIDGDGQ